MNRSILSMLLCGLAAIIASPLAAADTKVLNLFIWDEYIDPEVLQEFEQETGIRVVESNYGANEELLAKLQAGGGGYDIIVPSDYMVGIMVRQGILAKLDHSKLPNMKNVGERFHKSPADPDHDYAIPFQWGASGIAYNKVLYPNPPKSWKEFFDPARIKGARGRISMLNDVREVLGAALLAQGHSVNSTSVEELASAKVLVAGILPLLAKFDSEAFEDSLAANETILIHGWAGEISVAMDENEDIGFILPEDGAIVFVDNLCIPATSTNLEAAHLLIDFILRPDISARIANYTYYGTCNDAAVADVDEDLRNGPSFMQPAPEQTHYLIDLGDFTAEYERVWTELKTE